MVCFSTHELVHLKKEVTTNQSKALPPIYNAFQGMLGKFLVFIWLLSFCTESELLPVNNKSLSQHQKHFFIFAIVPQTAQTRTGHCTHNRNLDGHQMRRNYNNKNALQHFFISCTVLLTIIGTWFPFSYERTRLPWAVVNGKSVL